MCVFKTPEVLSMWLSLTLSSVMPGKGNQLKTVVGVD